MTYSFNHLTTEQALAELTMVRANITRVRGLGAGSEARAAHLASLVEAEAALVEHLAK